ncbi:hypothetical protein [Segatella baroniae]|uniref:hypothetical protein n=1 Tax=Segatella baroniae TaxID=305719 RepID=UPI000AF9E5E4|nr:hypothetical protein [Segatella baroniae]
MGWMKELGKAAAKVAEKPLAKVGVKFAEKSAESAEKSVGRALANAAMKEGRYASKANYTKWIESMGGKATKVESGFKSWEKSLPQFKTGFKSAEHIGSKTAQKTERIMVDGTKATGQGVVHSTKAAEKVAEETAKKAALINKETLKNAAKVGWREGGKVINKTAGWAGQYAKYSANHPVASLILSSIAYRQLTGRTLLPDMMKSLGGEDAAKKGLVGVLGETTLGKKVDGQGNEVGMIANLTDVLFGDGTYGRSVTVSVPLLVKQPGYIKALKVAFPLSWVKGLISTRQAKSRLVSIFRVMVWYLTATEVTMIPRLPNIRQHPK